jgi:hypothetical protein
MTQMLLGAPGLDIAREPRTFFLQQRVQCRVAIAVAKRADQALHERQPLLRCPGNGNRPAVSVCATEPSPQLAIGCAVHPANTRQPVTRAGQRTDRIPGQRRRLAGRLARDMATTPLRDYVLEDRDEVLAQAK